MRRDRAGREGAKGHRERGITTTTIQIHLPGWMLFVEALKRTVTVKQGGTS